MPDNDTSGLIDTLKAQIAKRKGLAKPTQFLVEFSLPAGVADPRDMQDLSIMCQSASLPTRAIDVTDYAGAQRHSFAIPNGYSYDEVTCKFLLGNDYFPKNIFDRWIDRSIDSKSYRLLYRNEYSSTITIYQLDGSGDIIYGVRLNHAFPTKIGDLELDGNTIDTVHMLSVTFKYYDYSIVDLAKQGL